MEKFKSRGGDQEFSALFLPLQGKRSFGKSLPCHYHYHHASGKGKMVHTPVEKNIWIIYYSEVLRTVIMELFFYLILISVYFFHYMMMGPLLAKIISHM